MCPYGTLISVITSIKFHNLDENGHHLLRENHLSLFLDRGCSSDVEHRLLLLNHFASKEWTQEALLLPIFKSIFTYDSVRFPAKPKLGLICDSKPVVRAFALGIATLEDETARKKILSALSHCLQIAHSVGASQELTALIPLKSQNYFKPHLSDKLWTTLFA